MKWQDLLTMAPKWIAHRIQLEILSTDLLCFRGPRIIEMERLGAETLRYRCDPWYFPIPMTAYHINFIDRLDDSMFHRMRIDPPRKEVSGAEMPITGALKICKFSGTITNLTWEQTLNE